MTKMKNLKMIPAPNFVDAMKRAVRGYQFLDKNEPGWQQKIKPEILSLDSSKSCIIGQVYGDYTHLTDDEESGGYGMTIDHTEWLGFEARTDTLEDESMAQDYSYLQEAWLMLLSNDWSWRK